ncbi:NifB/NifX family molybdenum-iron cluster-binding protein [Guyparkeria sp. 1SP6A2]|nr:NifB/NifX family molybdenum-iron cluster-binding protein [Guyparkeria sp. 1SP6A2]
MKIAVTSQNRRTVTSHAGRCRRFWIYRVEDGSPVGRELLELPREQSFHESTSGKAHPLDGIDALVTQGMGDGLARRLARMGASGYVTVESDPDQAVSLLLEGALGKRAVHDA